MNYRRTLVTQHGGPDVMHVVEDELRPPAAGQVRIKVLAAAVSRPDVTVGCGEALYTGTPLAQKLPFTPGYAVIGDVDAAGEGVSQAVVGQRVGALTVIGGYAEYLYWRSDRLIPVPASLHPAEDVPLILNYQVAYQLDQMFYPCYNQPCRHAAATWLLEVAHTGGADHERRNTLSRWHFLLGGPDDD